MIQQIFALFEQHGIQKEQLSQIIQSAQGNPMMLIGGLQSLGLPPQAMQAIGQQMMQLVMSNPNGLQELIAQLGVSEADAQNALKNIKN
jgi:hypothetical protein